MALQHSQKLRHWLAGVWAIANETLDEFSKDRGDLVAAALAFFTMLSLAPLIIIAVAGAGIILGQGAAHREALRVMEETMGPATASAIDSWVLEASRAGGVASLVGAGLTLFAASRFTNQLRSALNQVWNVDVRVAEGFKSTIKDYVKRRAFAFVLVLASGPVLLAVFLSRALLTGVGAAVFPEWQLGGASVQILQLLFSLVFVAAATAVVFRFVPDARVGWRAISRGALLTSVLFNLGNLLVGVYLGKASVGAAYGAAGSLVVVLLWLYFSAEMFLYGAEFTQIYARRHGCDLNEKGAAEVQSAQ